MELTGNYHEWAAGYCANVEESIGFLDWCEIRGHCETYGRWVLHARDLLDAYREEIAAH